MSYSLFITVDGEEMPVIDQAGKFGKLPVSTYDKDEADRLKADLLKRLKERDEDLDK